MQDIHPLLSLSKFITKAIHLFNNTRSLQFSSPEEKLKEIRSFVCFFLIELREVRERGRENPLVTTKQEHWNEMNRLRLVVVVLTSEWNY